MFRASRLPVPAGMRPNGMPVSARPEQITRMVPSPPAPSTRSTPSATAYAVMARPGSSGVVSRTEALPAAGLELVVHVAAERQPVDDLRRVVDHGARRRHVVAGQRGPAPDELVHEVVGQRDVHPRHQQRDGRGQRAEQRAADQVGDLVRAGTQRSSATAPTRPRRPARRSACAPSGARRRSSRRWRWSRTPSPTRAPTGRRSPGSSGRRGPGRAGSGGRPSSPARCRPTPAG